MSESELMYYTCDFRARVEMGEFCKGDDCPGMFLSETDVWEECQCVKRARYFRSVESESVPKSNPVDPDHIIF